MKSRQVGRAKAAPTFGGKQPKKNPHSRKPFEAQGKREWGTRPGAFIRKRTDLKIGSYERQTKEGGPSRLTSKVGAGRINVKPPLRESVRVMSCLVFGDDRAGYAGWGAGGNFLGYRVNDQGGAAVGEDRVALGAERDARRDDGDVRGSVGAHCQNKIRNISGRHAHVIVFAARCVEVRSRGLEIRRIAFREFVDVHEMGSGRQVLDIEFDLDAVRGFRKRGGADALVLGIYDLSDHGLWRRMFSILSNDGCSGKNKEKCH
jgi:hypothetical protein